MLAKFTIKAAILFTKSFWRFVDSAVRHLPKIIPQSFIDLHFMQNQQIYINTTYVLFIYCIIIEKR